LWQECNVRSNLEKVGIEVWMDDHIHAGDEWRNQIDLAIRSAFAMIVIMTPEAKASEYVTYEWSYAVGIGIRIIPIKYKQTPLHPRLEAFQFLDFSSRPWEKLIAEVKEAAKTALASAATQSKVLSFIEQAETALNSSNAATRQDAVATLAQATSADAQAALVEALAHPIADVRQRAAIAIGQMRYQEAVPLLIELLHDPMHSVRTACISSLEHMRDIRALPELLAILPDASLDEKMRIVKACSIFGDASVVSTLLRLYESADRELREVIIDTLAKLHAEIAIPQLKEALQDPEPGVCRRAAQAILQIGSKAALEAMTHALLHMNKMQCELMLKDLPVEMEKRDLAKASFDQLIADLDDTYRKHLPASSVGSDREKNAKARRRIIWIFSLLKNKKSVPTLIAAMDDEDPIVQQETIAAFRCIQDERLLPALMTILSWRFDYYDEKTLLYALQALRQMGNSNILPQLKAATNAMLEKDTELAVQTISLFGQFGNYETLEYLRGVKSYIQEQRTHKAEKKQELIESIDQALREVRLHL
jgi:HEAT repeat protein